jgi:hypothetical protein
VLGLVSERSTKDLRDPELLTGIGVSVGLSIENLRQLGGLEDALSLLTATLDSTADGIPVVDCAGKIVSYNWRFGEISGSRMTSSPDATITSSATFSTSWMTSRFPASGRRAVPCLKRQRTSHFKDACVFERLSRPSAWGETVGRLVLP